MSRILLMANFSAGQSRTRKPIRMDFDNFEEVLARIHPQLEVPGPDEPIRMRFESLDDFLPDALYQNVPLFQELRQHRERLLEAPARIPARRQSDEWQQAIEAIAAPHIQPTAGPRETLLAAQIDDTTQCAMRMVLHHPDLQELEAAWRSVDFLLRRAPDLQIYLLDLSKPELLANLDALPRLLGTGDPWTILAGLYTFEAQPEELRALGSIARIAADAGAPFLSSISPRMMGCESFGETPDPDDWTTPLADEAEAEWNDLRSRPEAQWIGLALPRFLLRDPYTKDSVQSFAFEEMTRPPNPADFLWANPAVACTLAATLGDAQISSLPVHAWQSDGETFMTPCAECWMTERTAEKFLDRGIMPLASIRHRDAVRLIRLQSIARPAAPLAGRWNE